MAKRKKAVKTHKAKATKKGWVVHLKPRPKVHHSNNVCEFCG